MKAVHFNKQILTETETLEAFDLPIARYTLYGWNFGQCEIRRTLSSKFTVAFESYVHELPGSWTVAR